MSRRNKKRYEGPSNTVVAPSPNTPIGGGGSIFAGANFSTRRGYIYVPTIETKRELDSYSHRELLRRARWLRRNTGFTRRCIHGIANMVGFMSPRALTGDKEWNKLAEALFEQRAGSALTFDKTGRFNVYNYQPLTTRTRLGDGDMLSVLTESDNNSGGAMVMTYEAHQVRDMRGDTADSQRRAGIISNPLGRPVAVNVIADPLTMESVQIPVSDCVLNADYESFGWQRGVTALHCAINHLLDSTEIISDVKLAIKGSSRIGYWEYTPDGKLSSVAGLKDKVRTGGPRCAPTGDTAKTGKGNEVQLEDAWRGGKIPSLDPGREIRQLLDERPHPNSMALLEWLNRDIAAGLDMSSDVLWNIAKLGGASVRYVLADAQTTIERHQQILVDQLLTRFWVYFIAKEIKAGRLRKCQDPQWWMVGWQPPAKLTVDIARDGKLSIDLHRAGMLTIKRWYGMQGLDDEAEDKMHVESYARRLALCMDIEKEWQAKGYPAIRIDPEKVFPTGIPGMGQNQPGNILDPSGNAVSSDPAFNAAERFTYIEGRLDDIAERLVA